MESTIHTTMPFRVSTRATNYRCGPKETDTYTKHYYCVTLCGREVASISEGEGLETERAALRAGIKAARRFARQSRTCEPPFVGVEVFS